MNSTQPSPLDGYIGAITLDVTRLIGVPLKRRYAGENANRRKVNTGWLA